MNQGLVILGEVHTGLLHHSSSLTPRATDSVLQLVPGEQVRRSNRPIAYARSPERLVGVDCSLPLTRGAAVRAIGTTVSRATIVGERILQGSAYVTVDRSPDTRRRPWSHYLSRRGVIETIGKAEPARITAGFLHATSPTDLLDLGALSADTIDTVQRHDALDHRTAFRSERTILRWAVTADDPSTPATFTIGDDRIRRVVLPLRECPTAAYVELCEDLAAHDWLLTTIDALVSRSRIGAASRSAVLYRLAPAIDHLLHLWMPAARADPALLDVWHGIEERPGFSRQWRVNVDRVRDQLSLSIAERLGGA